MTSTRPTAEAAGASGPARRPAAGRAVALLTLVALLARLRLRRSADRLGACVPARGEVAALGLVVAASGLLTALPLPIRWS
ncbi:hypothetical protein [Streptomyces sp. NPDC088358]|uniref:hypothetical protein n=1 Tax=Streptomyces sp. NPDC088358 TaxID=3365857 RepID=UPI00382DED13